MTVDQLTAGSLADAIGAVLDGPRDIVCTGVSSILEAKDGDVTFMVNAKYADFWKESDASIGIVQNGVDVPHHDASSRALLRVENAYIAIAHVLSLFTSEEDLPEIGIHSSAVVSPTATLGEGVRIGPYVVIADGAKVGEGVSMSSHVRIGRDCTIGDGTTLHSGVVIEYECVVGSNCTLHAHVTLGADGFGYHPNKEGSGLQKVPHVGNVVLCDDVEIGANSCVDRGKFSSTQIGCGTKIDNLVQIGHNCKIGNHCVIAAGTGIAGSVQVGHWVQIGAQVGIAPHCKVGDGAKMGAKSGLMHDIPAGEEWLGVPACRKKDVLRQWASTRKLPEIIAEFRRRKDK